LQLILGILQLSHEPLLVCPRVVKVNAQHGNITCSRFSLRTQLLTLLLNRPQEDGVMVQWCNGIAQLPLANTLGLCSILLRSQEWCWDLPVNHVLQRWKSV
jgi:hypothetical protein